MRRGEGEIHYAAGIGALPYRGKILISGTVPSSDVYTRVIALAQSSGYRAIDDRLVIDTGIRILPQTLSAELIALCCE